MILASRSGSLRFSKFLRYCRNEHCPTYSMTKFTEVRVSTVYKRRTTFLCSKRYKMAISRLTLLRLCESKSLYLSQDFMATRRFVCRSVADFTTAYDPYPIFIFINYTKQYFYNSQNIFYPKSLPFHNDLNQWPHHCKMSIQKYAHHAVCVYKTAMSKGVHPLKMIYEYGTHCLKECFLPLFFVMSRKDQGLFEEASQRLLSCVSHRRPKSNQNVENSD